MHATDANKTLAALGTDTTEPDYKMLQNIVIAHINKAGGVAGHPLVGVYYDVKTSDAPQDTSQKACTHWTEDHHVLAAMPTSPLADRGVLRQCLANAGALGLYPSHYSRTRDADFQRTPLWFEPELPSLETWARIYAVGLGRQGFYRGTKIGLVYDSDPAFTTVAENVLLPALRAEGADVVATFQSRVHGVGDAALGSRQMSNAVLNFRSAGVTNVLFFEVWQGWVLFAQQAEAQRWQPVYGLSSQNGAEAIIESGLIPTGQLAGAKLVSWNPNQDVKRRSAGSWPRLQLCQQIYRDAGVSDQLTSHAGYYGALMVCGGLLTLQDAGRVVIQPLNAASWARGLEQLGTSLTTPNVPAARFGPGRHFGAAGWRPGSYDSSCTCFKYTGPISRF